LVVTALAAMVVALLALLALLVLGWVWSVPTPMLETVTVGAACAPF
jgi:hypothetical protein